MRRINGLAALITICLILLFSGPAMALQVNANQSTLIDSTENIKRVSIAKPEIADVEVISPRQLLIIGKSPGTTTLVYWNVEEVPTTVDLTVGINVDLVREDLRKISPDQTFEVTAAGDALILTGTVGDNVVQTRLVEGARAYVKNVVNLLRVQKLEQVLLQIRVSEIDRSLAKELGFNFLFRGNTLVGGISPPNNFNPIGGDPLTPLLGLGDQLNAFITKPGLQDFAVLMRALEDKGGLKVLAEPNLVVANGAEGKFLVGGEFPIVINTATGGTAAYSVSYKEFGIRLNFQPKISSNGEIYINVSQEVSELDYANAVVLQGFRIPALKIRKAESGLQLADGQTFVMAGILDNKVSRQVSKFPLLGDIPILGALFRSTRYQNNETELMMMVTPKIVRPLNKDEIPTLPTERMDPVEISPDMFP